MSTIKRVGGSVSLSCIVHGYPIPVITWLKDNQELMPEGSSIQVTTSTNTSTMTATSFLVLANLNYFSSGVYSCSAENFIVVVSSANLTVNCEYQNFTCS